MAKNIKTHLYCFDDHRGFIEEIRKKFTDVSRYTILFFQTREEYLKKLVADRENSFCKIAILGLHDSREQYEMMDHLTLEIKRIDPGTGLILICPPDKIDTIRKIIRYNIDAYVPHNSNAILRIHNAVKKHVSEHSIGIFRRRRNISLIVLGGVIIISLVLLLLAFIRMPKYF